MRGSSSPSLSYRSKRIFGWIIANGQTLRWATQLFDLKHLNPLKEKPPTIVLEIGCGGGTYAIELGLKHGHTMILTDFLYDRVSLAKKQIEEAGFSSSAHFVVCDAQHLPFAHGSFDHTQAFEVLEHLDHPEFALSEIWRVSRPDASLLLSVPHPPEWFPNPDHRIEGYCLENIRTLLESQGWNIQSHCLGMLLVCRWIMALLQKIPFLPLIPLAAAENLIPRRWRHLFLPYDLMLLAQACDTPSRPSENEFPM